jgi:GNAT superfamily N-acetyltransferase
MTGPADILIKEFRFPDDYSTCVEIWQEVGGGIHLGFSDSLEEIGKKCQRDPDLFLLAFRDREAVGTVIGGFDGRRGMIYHLAVKKSAQHQGIGHMLMNEVEQRLTAKGCKKMYLMMVPDHEDLIEFYRTMGWSPMDIMVAAKEVR